MKLFINGGGREWDSLQNIEFTQWLSSIGVRKLLICMLAVKEEKYHTDFLQKRITISADIQTNLLSLANIKQAKILISNCDALFFTGGSPATLLQRIREHELKELIVSTEFTALGGASAGSMAMGEKTINGRHQVKHLLEGLGYFKDTIIDSHFTERSREKRLNTLLKANESMSGIGLDEDTWAIFDEDQNLERVIGPGTVSLHVDGTIQRYDSSYRTTN